MCNFTSQLYTGLTLTTLYQTWLQCLSEMLQKWETKSFLRLKSHPQCIFFPLQETTYETKSFETMPSRNQTGFHWLNSHFSGTEEQYLGNFFRCYFPRSPNSCQEVSKTNTEIDISQWSIDLQHQNSLRPGIQEIGGWEMGPGRGD